MKIDVFRGFLEDDLHIYSYNSYESNQIILLWLTYPNTQINSLPINLLQIYTEINSLPINLLQINSAKINGVPINSPSRNQLLLWSRVEICI